MHGTLRTMLNILLSPSEAFLGLKERPGWIAAFATIAIASAMCILLSMPFAKQAAVASLSGTMSAEELDSAVSFSKQVQYLMTLVVPLGLLGKWLLITVFLYACIVILDGNDPHFHQVFATVVYAEGILVLMAWVNLLLLYLKGPQSIHDPTDLQAIAGLDIFLSDPSTHVSLFAFLNGVNPFSVWYIVTLSTGISVMTGVGKIKSGTMVTILWLAGLGFQSGVAAAGASLRAAVTG
jgi:hypothetical protein